MTETPSLPAGFTLVARDIVDSTNVEARAFAAQGASDGTLVWAREQRAGRGRRGRVWSSPAGNLYLSMLLRPGGSPARALQLGFVASIAVAEALDARVGNIGKASVKWPNDVLLEDRKIAGILLESATIGSGEVDWLILGIGVNLVSHPEDLPYLATDVRSASGKVLSPEDMLSAVTERFAVWRQLWGEQGFPPIRTAWLTRAWRLGKTIEVARGEGEQRLVGRFLGLDEQGALELEAEDETLHKIAFGEIFPAEDPVKE